MSSIVDDFLGYMNLLHTQEGGRGAKTVFSTPIELIVLGNLGRASSPEQAVDIVIDEMAKQSGEFAAKSRIATALMQSVMHPTKGNPVLRGCMNRVNHLKHGGVAGVLIGLMIAYRRSYGAVTFCEDDLKALILSLIYAPNDSANWQEEEEGARAMDAAIKGFVEYTEEGLHSAARIIMLYELAREIVSRENERRNRVGQVFVEKLSHRLLNRLNVPQRFRMLVGEFEKMM